MDKYGLIGYPLGHSFSVSFFNEKFANEGINARYINFEIPNIEDLPEILASTPELKGLNVTIPYKQKVISYIDELSPEARAIGAVNVIRITRKGKNLRVWTEVARTRNVVCKQNQERRLHNIRRSTP